MTAPRRALVVVDVQNDYFDGVLTIQYPPRDESVANTAAIIDAANDAGLPVVLARHQMPAGAPVFAEGSDGAEVHPEIASRERDAWKRTTKGVASVLVDESVVEFLREREVDTLTVVGYMTNNCVLGTAAGAEPLGFAVEVISDATGAINLANEAGMVPAKQLHETLMTLLNSNFAAVATTDAWRTALGEGEALPKSDLGTSAAQGAAAFAAV